MSLCGQEVKMIKHRQYILSFLTMHKNSVLYMWGKVQSEGWLFWRLSGRWMVSHRLQGKSLANVTVAFVLVRMTESPKATPLAKYG